MVQRSYREPQRAAPRRRPHLRPREPPSVRGRLRGALAPPSACPLQVRDMVPLARWGETHDIGLAAVYLSSAAGGYVNAETLVVDGGHWHDSARAFWQGREALRAMSQQRRSKL